jgi:hypothetical protein
MKKLFTVSSGTNSGYETYEEAEKAAKKYASRDQGDYYVYQAIAKAEYPLSEIVVTKL